MLIKLTDQDGHPVLVETTNISRVEPMPDDYRGNAKLYMSQGPYPDIIVAETLDQIENAAEPDYWPTPIWLVLGCIIGILWMIAGKL